MCRYVDGCGGIFLRAKNWTMMIDRVRKFLLFVAAYFATEVRTALLSVLLLRAPAGCFFLPGANETFSPSFARKLHAPFSDASRALSPCVESGLDTVFADGIIV